MGRRALISVPKATGLPPQLFFAGRSERINRAREMFFEKGELPFGLVSDDVIHSWNRCQRAGVRPQKQPSFEPVPRSRIEDLLHRRQPLLRASDAEFEALSMALRGTRCRVLLMDHTPAMLRVSPSAGQDDGPMLRVSALPGFRFDELSVGTGASNLAVSSGRIQVVNAGEHYSQSMEEVHCIAAPIHGSATQVVGVLCVLREGGPMTLDPLQLVCGSVAAIENRFMRLRPQVHVVVRFHPQSACLDTPLEALLTFDEHARLLDANVVAREWIGAGLQDGANAGEILDRGLEPLLARAGHSPVPVRLVSGLQVWACAQSVDQRGAWGRLPTSTASAGVQRGAVQALSRELVAAELKRQQGNISAAARVLGVSRNYLYRRMAPP